jgi:cyclic dehypoxanthinyl futalosine synthase|tara:strand:+ start:1596 stop:2648 length:1053 start_codon:yes stop_codon:yes gene_type:complete
MIDSILEKARDGRKVNRKEACLLFKTDDIISLGNTANSIKNSKQPNSIITYIIDRNINYSNICVSRCLFCAFYRQNNQPDAYVLSEKEISEKISETLQKDGIQILMQGGLHPDFKIDFYEKLLKDIKKNHNIHIHAYSPPEIVHIAKLSKLKIEEVLKRLKKAGLDTIPGGGAEILVDRVRKKISPDKCTSQEWLDVMKTAHSLGIRSSATMMFGHIETIEDRVDHLMKIRDLQDKTEGFTAFIPWPFQPKNTQLNSIAVSGFEYLKTLAVSRIVLDNITNIQASWVTQGAKIAQMALLFGANDMGSTMLEENVVKAAGVSFQMSENDIKRLITDLNLIPRRRNNNYQLL